MTCRSGWLMLLGLLWGCDQQTNLLVVTFAGAPARTAELSVTATLDGKPAMKGMSFPSSVDRFAVRLPAEASGHLALSAQAIDSDSCTQATSSLEVDLPSSAKNLDLPLTVQSPRKCGGLAPCAARTVCPTTNPGAQTIQSIWPISPSDIWAVGNGVTLLHFDGNTWTAKPAPVGATGNLYGVWASASNNVWAVGDGSLILHYDGTSWSTVVSPSTLRLWSISGVSSSDIWAVGDSATTTTQGTALHYNGTKWLAVTDPGLGVGQISSVWASSSDFVYVCGVGGLLARYNGATWTSISASTTVNLHAVWGTPGGLSSSVVFAVGDTGSIFRIRYAVDTQWAKLPTSGTLGNLYQIHGDNSQVVYAVGSNGVILSADAPYDTFTAGNAPSMLTLFTVRTGANGLTWVGGIGGFLGYLDLRP